MEGKRQFLKLSILILKILAFAAVAAGIVGAGIILLGKAPAVDKWASLGAFFMGLFYFFVFYLVSELIGLILDIDHRVQRLTEPSKKEIR